MKTKLCVCETRTLLIYQEFFEDMDRFFLRLLAAFGLFAAATAVSNAQATRTWVSGVGDDVNPCSRTAPCKTFAGAISKTATNGEINALDPGGFGTVNITKSITIDGGPTALASILAAGTTGIIINSATANVTIRNISINGAGTGTFGIRILAAKKVVIENCVIFGFTSGATNSRGISDERSAASGSGNLFVTNTSIFNNGQSNVVITPVSGATVNAVIMDSRLEGSTSNSGLVVLASANVLVKNTVISGNFNTGIFVQEDFGSVDINVENCQISNNAVGVNVFSGAPIVRLSNTMITGNTTGIQGSNIFSFGNNKISGNSGGNGPIAPANQIPQT